MPRLGIQGHGNCVTEGGGGQCVGGEIGVIYSQPRVAEQSHGEWLI